MDVNMPVMGGPTAAGRLRTGGGSQAGVPVFALTADVLPDHVAPYRRAGFSAVLTKPVDWGRLKDLLDAAMLAPQDNVQKLLGDFWASGLDEAAVEADGAKPIAPSGAACPSGTRGTDR